MSSIIVNIFGGPGVGKSTMAATLYAEFSRLGISAEYVPEFAKELVWDDSGAITDQLFVFANQARMITRLIGRVEVIVTDSPVLLSAVYHAENTSNTFKALVMEYHNTTPSVNYFVQRSIPFKPVGRVHNLSESKLLDQQIESYLTKNGVKFESVFPGEYILDLLIQDILTEKNKTIRGAVKCL